MKEKIRLRRKSEEPFKELSMMKEGLVMKN
jgi:hypothetical protein